MSMLLASRDDPDADTIDAVIFDMDGVVTDSAQAHFNAWKEVFDEFLQARAQGDGKAFRPFTQDDYLAHVDGVPRYDGVRQFVESRGIRLPMGSENDRGLETIYGLGNTKNERFQTWLERNKVRTFDDAVHLIHALRNRGVKVGVFSASKNAARVLESAGVRELFDAEVDGREAERLDLPGKPDPAMLIETAKRLGSNPSHAVVVEDAVSGVQAASAGKFRLVIGVNREQDRSDSHGLDLRANGADLVTRDLKRLIVGDDVELKTVDRLVPVWDRLADLESRIADRPLAIFLDYDGTLTPIVEDYQKATLSKAMNSALKRLARCCRVAIISGRDLMDVRNRVDIRNLYFAGSHGFDIAGPACFRERVKEGERYLPALDDAEEELRDALEPVEGAAVERKTFSIAIHYRQVARQDVESVERTVDQVVEKHEDLRKSEGKKVFQVQPRADWDKGRAVRWLLNHTSLGAGDPLAIYIGDDLTDEDAFEELSGEGIGIVVRDGSRATAADYSLQDPEDVQSFLTWLSKRSETA